jgi:hypothetical protein
MASRGSRVLHGQATAVGRFLAKKVMDRPTLGKPSTSIEGPSESSSLFAPQPYQEHDPTIGSDDVGKGGSETRWQRHEPMHDIGDEVTLE